MAEKGLEARFSKKCVRELVNSSEYFTQIVSYIACSFLSDLCSLYTMQ